MRAGAQAPGGRNFPACRQGSLLPASSGHWDAPLAGLRRISKPGLRVYAKSTNLPRVLGGLGVAIISTSHGLQTERQAHKNGVGGEVLAYVW